MFSFAKSFVPDFKDRLNAALKGISPARKNPCGGCCTRIQSLGVAIGGRVILENVDIHIHCGELTVLIGPNGAGKTTLFRAILGEVPYSGSLQFLKSESTETAVPLIGYVPQNLDFDKSAPFTVLDLFLSVLSGRPLWLAPGKKARQLALDALRLIEGTHLQNQTLGRLSGGELQRVLLALAFTPVPDILLLDEPVSGIDPAGVEMFYRMVSDLRVKYHISIVMVSHDIVEAARYADRIIFLNRTVISQGSPEEVLAHQAAIQTFGKVAIPHGLRRRPEHPACDSEEKTI